MKQNVKFFWEVRNTKTIKLSFTIMRWICLLILKKKMVLWKSWFFKICRFGFRNFERFFENNEDFGKKKCFSLFFCESHKHLKPSKLSVTIIRWICLLILKKKFVFWKSWFFKICRFGFRIFEKKRRFLENDEDVWNFYFFLKIKNVEKSWKINFFIKILLFSESAEKFI